MRGKILLCASVLSLIFLAGTASAEYMGSQFCSDCHPDEYSEWQTSKHPYMLQTRAEAEAAGYPLIEGLTWDDVTYTIGGKWKLRYLDTNGYFWTTDGYGDPGNNQWNFGSEKWATYHGGEVKKYTCGGCHTTGYSPEGHQGGLEGIKGTWNEEGVGCEACHGPGWDMIVDDSTELCGKCHIRAKNIQYTIGDPESLSYDPHPTMNPYKHHQQYLDYLLSDHNDAGVDCIDCHNPHTSATILPADDNALCLDCHQEMVYSFQGFGKAMIKKGVRCIDCHMPMSHKSAEKYDVRSHSFNMVDNPEDSTYTPEKSYATMYPRFSCGTQGMGGVSWEYKDGQWTSSPGCHANKKDEWAAKQLEKGLIHGKLS